MSKVGSQILHNTTLDIYKDPDVSSRYLRANKIVCTIGPVTQSVESIKGLIEAGLMVVRNNFSHGSHEYHARNSRTRGRRLRSWGARTLRLRSTPRGPRSALETSPKAR